VKIHYFQTDNALSQCTAALCPGIKLKGEAGTHLRLLFVFLMRETTFHFPTCLMAVVPNYGLGQIHPSTFNILYCVH